MHSSVRGLSFAALSFLAVTLAAPSPALADEPEASPPAREIGTRWYGYQTLAADGLALGIGALAPSSGDGFAYAGLGTYALGAPIVHLAHGQPAKALASAALRVGAPFAGAFAGGFVATLASSDDPAVALSDLYVGMAYGALAGLAAAVIVDTVVLAREPVAAKPAESGFTPYVSVGANGGSAGVARTF